MASAALDTRNELIWAQSCAAAGGFMGKTPNSRPHLKPSANSNPKKKQKYLHHGVNGRQNDDLPAVKQTASDDAYSFNQPSKESNGLNFGSYLTYNVTSCSKAELSELRKRLGAELEQIRNLRDRIESGHFSTSTTNPRPFGKSKKMPGNKELISVGSDSDPRRFSNKNAGVVCDGFSVIDVENMMKDCRQILTKLMKHKNGWIFNSPVDAAALGLHDYHQIIKRPMDLGTVKSNLVKNWYPSPVEFAADVRLTFNNALLYNPKTDQVHGWAGILLARFEELFKPIQDKLDTVYTVDNERKEILGVDEFHDSHWNHISTPDIAKKPKPSPIPQVPKKQEILHSQSSASTPSVPPPPSNPPMRKQSPIPPPSAMTAPTAKPIPGRGTTGKQPKPRAKDPNKREMSMEEKHKLGIGLQSLPQEKMPQLVQIIRKRNEHLAQDDEEIELDIEALDTETLWELDRFVTNWKKMVSKTKRQALIGNLTAPTAAPTTSNTEAEADEDAVFEKNDSTEQPKRIEVGDEDVDIDDDMPAASFPPVEIEKDEAAGREPDNRSSSSSSSGSSCSDSSSSSGSDSGSSSGSDSDADDAQS